MTPLTEKQKQLVQDNLGLAHLFAYKSPEARCHPELVADFVQDAMLGLIQAVQRWDPAKGALSTYSGYWMRQSIKTANRRRYQLIRRPQAHPFKAVSVLRDEDYFSALVDDTEPIDELIAQRELVEKAQAAAENLPSRQREVFERRILSDDDESLQEVGDDLGLTRERIRQIEVEAVTKIRQRVA